MTQTQTHDPVGDGADHSRRLLMDLFERVRRLVPEVVHGLSREELTWRPDADANSIGWLVWHLARVQDDHVAGIAGAEQIWGREGWDDRFDLPYQVAAIGYGHSSSEVGDFSIDDPALLTGYYDAVSTRTREVLAAMSTTDLDRVVDESYDPPVTAGTRLVSVVNDTTQHIGQAAYVRGLAERRRRT